MSINKKRLRIKENNLNGKLNGPWTITRSHVRLIIYGKENEVLTLYGGFIKPC